MNVRMPDGTIIENVPEGITQSELLRRYKKYAQQDAPSAEDPGFLQSMIIGAGRTFDQAGKGITQGALGLSSMLPGAAGRIAKDEAQKMAEVEAENSRIYAGLQEKRPGATFIGEALPLVAALPASGSMAGAAALGALPGAISYGSPEDRATNAALGAAGGSVGAGAGKLIGRALNPVRAAPNAAMDDAMQAAARLGYRPTVGQETGSRALQLMEQQAAKNPISGRGAQAYNTANQEAINRAATRAMGESGDKIAEETMAAARARLGGEFDRLSQGKEIPLGKAFSARIDLLERQLENAGPFKNAQTANVLTAARTVADSGRVTGEAYQAIRSELTDIVSSASRAGNAKVAGSVRQVRKALDDAAEKALSPDDLAAWKMARAQYAAMKTLEKKGAIKSGDVDPAIIRNALQSGDRAGFARGSMTGDMADIARIGNAFRPLPDSGTAGNAITQMLLTGGAGLMGPQALAASLLAPLAANKALFSKSGQKYLRDGAVRVTPEIERRLMQGGFGLLGLPLIAGAQ